MKIIATSSSAECLLEYFRTCEPKLQEIFYIETGYTSRLCTSEETWDSIPKDVQDFIEARTYGFIDGWEAKK